MGRFITFCLFLCIASGTTFAQAVPQHQEARLNTSPTLSLSNHYIDSIQSFELTIQAKTEFPVGDELYWHARIIKTDSTGSATTEKLKGFCFLGSDSALIMRRIVPVSKENYVIYVYLLSRDFVIDQFVWQLDQQTIPEAQKVNIPKAAPLTKLQLAPDGFDLGGLVFNETRTRVGREFFALFAQNWRPPTQTEAYWITIREFPTPGRFTMISVSINNRELFQRFLIPRKAQMEDLVVYTVQLLQDQLSQGEIEGLFSDSDLKGSVIEDTNPEKF
jgi:Curli assembly protein CsgE